MTTMVLQAGVETRNAMAFYVGLADYTASADKAYADAEPTSDCMSHGRMAMFSICGRRGRTKYTHRLIRCAGRLNGPRPPAQNAPAMANRKNAQVA